MDEGRVADCRQPVVTTLKRQQPRKPDEGVAGVREPHTIEIIFNFDHPCA
jgi:hypothetical protein